MIAGGMAIAARRAHRRLGILALTAALLLAPLTPLQAQEAAPAGASRTPSTTPHRPLGVSAWVGHFSPRGDSDFHRLAQRHLAMAPGKLGGATLGLEAAYRLHPQWEALVAFETASADAPSGARAGSGEAITQRTRLSGTSAWQAGVRAFPLREGAGPGGSVHPWAEVTAGWAGYTLEQDGRFPDAWSGVDFDGDFRSSGGGVVGGAGVGVLVTPRPRLQVMAGLRYRLGEAGMDQDYSALGPLDLAGLGVAVGAGWRW